MDVILEKIEARLSSIIEIESGIHDSCDRGMDSTEIQQQIAWIQRQLSTLVSKLQGMLEDLNSGLSIAEMGFTDTDEMHDFLQDLATQIEQLKSLALAISKGIGQGI